MARMLTFSSGPLAEDPHHWGDVFCRTTMSNGQERLEIGCSERQVEVLRDLTAELEAPYWILYVLIVARTGQESGRYELSAMGPSSSKMVDTPSGSAAPTANSSSRRTISTTITSSSIP
jgi:hypothetical protein